MTHVHVDYDETINRYVVQLDGVTVAQFPDLSQALDVAKREAAKCSAVPNVHVS